MESEDQRKVSSPSQFSERMNKATKRRVSENQPAPEVKKRRGRPLKNPVVIDTSSIQPGIEVKKRRGRPPKNPVALDTSSIQPGIEIKKRRGRPPKNPVAIDTSSIQPGIEVKKRRGRPPKNPVGIHTSSIQPGIEVKKRRGRPPKNRPMIDNSSIPEVGPVTRRRRRKKLMGTPPKNLPITNFSLPADFFIGHTPPVGNRREFLQLKVRLDKNAISRYLMAVDAKKAIEEYITKKNPNYFNKNYFRSLKDYRVQKILGTGGYGKVLSAKTFSNDKVAHVAMKKIDLVLVKKKGIERQVANEILIHSTLHHPNIIPFHSMFFNETILYLILDEAASGSLYDIMQAYDRPLTSCETAHYLYQVASALDYCHNNKVIHRDVKPENVLIDSNNNALLSDFGWACWMKPSGHAQFCGTPDYYSPELLQGLTYDHRVDIWSLGILMYEMLVGDVPFHGSTHEEVLAQMKWKPVSYPLNVTNSGVKLLSSMMKFSPHQRASLPEILSHPWMREYKNAVKI